MIFSKANKNLKYWVVYFLLQSSLCCYALQTPDVLFVLYDAGETNALTPVAIELIQKKKTVNILAFATAKKLTKKGHPLKRYVLNCHLNTMTDSNKLNRGSTLSRQDLRLVDHCVRPKLIITGFASTLQAQVVELFKKQGIKSLGFYDAFHLLKPTHYLKSLMSDVDVVMVGEQSLKTKLLKSYPHINVTVTGHPGITKWLEEPGVSKPAIKRKSGINNSYPVILYIGGYGKDYEKSFKLFIQSIKSLKNHNVIVSPHPKTNGDFEKSVLDKINTSFIFISPNSLPTVTLSHISDLLICHRSTACVQGFYANKNILYIDLEPQTYNNHLISDQKAQQLSQTKDIIPRIKKLLSHPDTRANDQTQLLAIQNITNLILLNLK